MSSLAIQRGDTPRRPEPLGEASIEEMIEELSAAGEMRLQTFADRTWTVQLRFTTPAGTRASVTSEYHHPSCREALELARQRLYELRHVLGCGQ